jgi:hypothetical protein
MIEDLTKAEQAEIDEMVGNLKRAGAGQQQVDQSIRNLHSRLAWNRLPRSAKPLPASCGVTQRGKLFASADDSRRYWQQTAEERAAEDAQVQAEASETGLRREISKEHRRLSSEGGDPSRLTALLAKKRK